MEEELAEYRGREAELAKEEANARDRRAEQLAQLRQELARILDPRSANLIENLIDLKLAMTMEKR
jgi:hypothetical protein